MPDTAGRKTDLTRDLASLYQCSAREVALVDVPELSYLLVDGAGNPNTAPAYRNAVAALYGLSYTLKFLVKRGPEAIDYKVMPLEGLWWADDEGSFRLGDKDAWRWTAMIAQPDFITADLVAEAAVQVARKPDAPDLSPVRFERFREGHSAQLPHLGPYAAEAPTIERLHHFIQGHGLRLAGKHHEIYLSDPRRTAPERLRTIIRQPVHPA